MLKQLNQETVNHLVIGSIPTRAAIRRDTQTCLAHGLAAGVEMTSNPLIVAARRMVPSLSRGLPVVYLIRLQSAMIYIGCSLDFEQRLKDHSDGNACLTTARDPVVEVLRIEPYSTFSEARIREAQLKRWSRSKKEALVRGDIPALQTLAKSKK